MFEAEFEERIITLFKENKGRYGARKLKQLIEADGQTVSRRRIRRIMKIHNLISVYQNSIFKPHSKGKNEALIPNRLDRQFHEHKPLAVLVTDLTYVRIGSRWSYVGFIIDLYNREIIGLSVGWHKIADLVKKAIQSVPYALTKVNLFHSDRGNEFDNDIIDEMLETFEITRSLSRACCPYHNEIAESTYKFFKLEFINQETFHSLEELSEHQNKKLCPLVELQPNTW